jgi:hypothetical protein
MKTTKDTCLSVGAGKTNPTVRQLTKYPMVYTATDGKTKRMGEIVYVTTREEVERLDLSRFVATFGIHQPKSKLRQLRGRIIYTIHGYDNEAEIYEILDVRRFYSAVHVMWPCWLFTACLASASLRVIALSVVSNMSVARSGNECRTRIPGHDIKKFFVESLPAAGLLFARAGISRQYGSKYLKYVANHLGIPLE